MKNRRILCISAGQLQPKKADNPLARLHLYLNYGLLGLATILRERGYDPVVIHGRFSEPGLGQGELTALSGRDPRIDRRDS